LCFGTSPIEKEPTKLPIKYVAAEMIPGSLTELLTNERTVLHIIQIYANQKFSIHKKNLNKLAGASQKKTFFICP
jgi:hypothetical protein